MEIKFNNRESKEIKKLFDSGIAESVSVAFVAEQSKKRGEFHLITEISYFIPCESEEETDKLIKKLESDESIKKFNVSIEKIHENIKENKKLKEDNSKMKKELKSSKTLKQKPVSKAVPIQPTQ